MRSLNEIVSSLWRIPSLLSIEIEMLLSGVKAIHPTNLQFHHMKCPNVSTKSGKFEWRWSYGYAYETGDVQTRDTFLKHHAFPITTLWQINSCFIHVRCKCHGTAHSFQIKIKTTVFHVFEFGLYLCKAAFGSCYDMPFYDYIECIAQSR